MKASLCLFLSVACTPSTDGERPIGTDSAQTDSGVGDSGPVPESLQTPCEAGEDGTADVQLARVLSSDVTWTLAFDAEAEANGFADCSYRRLFEGAEVLDLPWNCADCTMIVQGDATMQPHTGEGLGGVDCAALITGNTEATRTEQWGLTVTEGSAGLHRATRAQYPMGSLTTVEGLAEGAVVPVGWESEYTMTDGGSMLLSAAGTLSWQTSEETWLEDPFGPRAGPYACGWECNDPGGLTNGYRPTVGDVLPNGRFRDSCGEMVELWDFHGSWLILDSSQHDCGPCQRMAEESGAFLADMVAAGIPVRMVTLMGNGLAAPHETPDEALVAEWIDAFDLVDPVLADRGYAHSLFPEFIDGVTGEDYGFPAWILVNPEMELVHGEVGFSSWKPIAEMILAAEGR